MTKPSDPARYPVSFRDAVDLALQTGEVTIPCAGATPGQLRTHFYGYLAALRKHGQREKADALVLQIDEKNLYLRLREGQSFAVDVANAVKAKKAELGSGDSLSGDSPDELFNRLTPR